MTTHLNNETTLFDFEDGYGPVPAHRHPNGLGWVANTAEVAPSAFVGPHARVYHYAKVMDDAVLLGHSEVSGHALIKGHAGLAGHACLTAWCQIEDAIKVGGNTFLAGQQHLRGHQIIFETSPASGEHICTDCPERIWENYGAVRESFCTQCVRLYQKLAQYSLHRADNTHKKINVNTGRPLNS
mgnify:CR=1 FL=1